jgi:hypothetical protein
MDENRCRTAFPLHNGRGPAGPGIGKRQPAPVGVYECRGPRQPVADLQRRVAHCPGQFFPQGPGPGLAELDHEIGDRCPLPRAEQEARHEHARDDDQRHLVREQRRQAGPCRRDEQVGYRARGEHETQDGGGPQRDQAHPAGRAHHPGAVVAAHPEQQRGEQDRGGFVLPDRRDDRRGVEDGDRRAGDP